MGKGKGVWQVDRDEAHGGFEWDPQAEDQPRKEANVVDQEAHVVDQEGHQVTIRSRVLGNFTPEIFAVDQLTHGGPPKAPIVCKFSAAYSRLTVFRRCQKDLLRIREVLEGSHGGMHQDGEVHERPFPEITRRRQDSQPQGSPREQQRGERWEDRRRKGQ